MGTEKKYCSICAWRENCRKRFSIVTDASGCTPLFQVFETADQHALDTLAEERTEMMLYRSKTDRVLWPEIAIATRSCTTTRTMFRKAVRRNWKRAENHTRGPSGAVDEKRFDKG
jgi:hypothetical protein